MIAGLFATGRAWLGRNGILAAAIAAFVGFVLAHDSRMIATGRKLEQADTLKKGAQLNAKAIAAHDAAQRPGAVERLRRNYCDDC